MGNCATKQPLTNEEPVPEQKPETASVPEEATANTVDREVVVDENQQEEVKKPETDEVVVKPAEETPSEPPKGATLAISEEPASETKTEEPPAVAVATVVEEESVSVPVEKAEEKAEVAVVAAPPLTEAKDEESKAEA